MPAPPFARGPDAPRTSEPEPSLPPPGRSVRMVARVLLWALIGIAALHGVLPTQATPAGSGSADAPLQASSDPQGSRSAEATQRQIGMATAAAFLREYLTVDGRRGGQPGRLERYLARGVDLAEGVVPDPGVSQSADLVLPATAQATKDGMDVTVLAHLLRMRDGPVQDGGTVAFVVPIVSGPKGLAVGGIPRPVALPIDPGLTARLVALPMALARTTAVAAGQAVAAVLNGDRATLVRLGGGTAPTVRPFPEGWRPVGITAIRPAGPPETPTAQVLVRARPAVAGIEYLLPVRVFLRPGTGTLTVREIDGGGRP